MLPAAAAVAGAEGGASPSSWWSGEVTYRPFYSDREVGLVAMVPMQGGQACPHLAVQYMLIAPNGDLTYMAAATDHS